MDHRLRVVVVAQRRVRRQPDADRLVAAIHGDEVHVDVDQQVGLGGPLADLDVLALLGRAEVGQLGAVPGWPGADVYPPQPMVSQLRSVRRAYAARGGLVTEHEIPAILEAAAAAGARFAGYTILRLPYAVKDIFRAWLETHFPDRAEKVLNRVRDLRGGKLNVSDFGERFRGTGAMADEIAGLFAVTARRAGLNREPLALSTAAFRRPGPAQLDLFAP